MARPKTVGLFSKLDRTGMMVGGSAGYLLEEKETASQLFRDDSGVPRFELFFIFGRSGQDNGRRAQLLDQDVELGYIRIYDALKLGQ